MCLASFYIFNRVAAKNALSELKIKNGKSLKGKIFLAMMALTVWFFISAFLHADYFAITLARSLKAFELILLTIFVASTFKHTDFRVTSLFIIIISAIFQSIIAIYQYIFQKSLFISPFWHKLTGESILSPELPGIAKIQSDGEKLIRSYGTFPHPNILGGFLIMSIFISIFLYLRHNTSILSSITSLLKPKSISNSDKLASLFWLIAFTTQFMALILTFSRSAWLGFALSSAVFTLLAFRRIKIVSRETIKNRLSNHKELLCALLLAITFLISNTQIVSNRISQDISPENQTIDQEQYIPQNDALKDRDFFNIVSRETISRYPLLGSGPGTAIFQIDPYLEKTGQNRSIEPWQYQPPHNIYSLSTSELGILGFLMMSFIIIASAYYSFKQIVSRETISEDRLFRICSLSVFVGILFIGFFDHYAWTLQQGQIEFWIIVGMLLI